MTFNPTGSGASHTDTTFNIPSRSAKVQYEIRMPSPNQHCIYVKGSSDPVRCYDTHAEAQQQIEVLRGGKRMGENQKSASYLVNLSELDFSDGNHTKWVHALPVGKFTHPKYGNLNLTQNKIGKFVQSFKDNKRVIELSINYDHEEKGPAAGWVKDAQSRDDGLWYNIEFVPDAVDAIQNKKYKYFSAEYLDLWKDELGNQHEDVLVGGALTNRPFMKRLIPINLSETDAQNVLDLVNLAEPTVPDPEPTNSPANNPEPTNNPTNEPEKDEGGAMTKEEMEAIVAGVTAKLAEQFKTAPTNTPGPNNDPNNPDPNATVKVKLAELDGLTELEAFKELAEANPILGQLVQTFERQAHALEQNKVQMREQVLDVKLREFDQTSLSLSIPARKLAREIAYELSDDGVTKFFEFLGMVRKGANFLVKLDEKSAKARKYSFADDERDATTLFMERVNDLVANDKLEYTTALNKVAKDDPELYQRFRAGEGAPVSL